MTDKPPQLSSVNKSIIIIIIIIRLGHTTTITAIILLYIVHVSCGILYHYICMFCSHALLPLSKCNFFLHSGSVLVLAHIFVQISLKN